MLDEQFCLQARISLPLHIQVCDLFMNWNIHIFIKHMAKTK